MFVWKGAGPPAEHPTRCWREKVYGGPCKFQKFYLAFAGIVCSSGGLLPFPPVGIGDRALGSIGIIVQPHEAFSQLGPNINLCTRRHKCD